MSYGKIDQKGEPIPINNQKTASFEQVFAGSTGCDYFLMFTGVIGGLVTGASIPFFNVLFGRMLDALNGDPGRFLFYIHIYKHI